MTAGTPGPQDGAAQRFAKLTAAFEAQRRRLFPALHRFGRQVVRHELRSCAPLLGGAGSERAFGVGVEVTLFFESRLLLEPYTDFGGALRDVDRPGPILARAAQDTRAVRKQIASYAHANEDPCAFARVWQAAGWSRQYSVAATLDASTLSRINRDAATAAQRLQAAGVSPAIVQAFTQDIDPTDSGG